MKHNWRKRVLKDILDKNPKGYLVANKYKVLIGMLNRKYPELAGIDYRRLQDIVFDAVNGNRDWQQISEGHDKLNKIVRDQEWKMEHGYHDFPGSYQRPGQGS